MTDKPIRLAVLSCDDPLDDARKADGGHFGVFKTLFSKASKASRASAAGATSDRLELSSYAVYGDDNAGNLPNPDEIDAILISGSRYSADDDDKWIVKLVDFVKDILANRPNIKVIGVCFGHQVVGRALGAELKRNEKGWDVSCTPLKLTNKGVELFGKSAVSLHLMNKDIVATCPAGVESLASSDKTDIHGLYIPNKLITVQGHPEFQAQYIKELVKLRNESGVIDDETAKDALARADDKDDGIAVGEAFLLFLFGK